MLCTKRTCLKKGTTVGYLDEKMPFSQLPFQENPIVSCYRVAFHLGVYSKAGLCIDTGVVQRKEGEGGRTIQGFFNGVPRLTWIKGVGGERV